jgi:hypothetical protein
VPVLRPDFLVVRVPGSLVLTISKTPRAVTSPPLPQGAGPALFGNADNNGYGLKVFAFLKLAGVPFTHRHIFNASAARSA